MDFQIGSKNNFINKMKKITKELNSDYGIVISKKIKSFTKNMLEIIKTRDLEYFLVLNQ